MTRPASIAAGWVWAHRRAGLNPRSHWRVLRGAGAGLFRKAPTLPGTVNPDGKALARVLRMRA